MKQKSEFTIIGRAMATIAGFDRVYRTLEQQFVLRGRAKSTFKRLTGFDLCKCPKCEIGNMIPVEILPRIRSPDNVFYPDSRDVGILHPRITNLNP